MKKEDFAEVLGDINEKHIVEARAERKAKKPVWVKWGAMAVCLCLVIVGFCQMNTDNYSDKATGSIMSGGATIGEENLGDRDKENYVESYEEAVTAQPDEIGKQDTEFEDATGMVADAPVQTETNLNDNKDELNDLYGGSYLDENGNYVIWLTENTAENQKKVFERNPDLLEDSTVFKPADFSLNYLTELLKNISEGMQDGKLPYVTSAGVMEQINRVSVTMTTDDEKAMATISSFDTCGGAIEFHYVTGNSKEDLATANQDL